MTIHQRDRTTITDRPASASAPANDSAIVTRDLTKRYDRPQPALDGLNLTVRRGEVFGFLGPNGAGKSTTIRLLLDLIRPTGGTATILGHDSQRDSVAIRQRTGYLPGELHLPGRETAGDFLLHLGYLRGGPDGPRIRDLAERLQLDLGRPVGKLSKGNKQKVGLIQAFMHTPDLLILDEPTDGLDPLVQHTFQEMVREARANGQTVFLSSHTLPEVERIADRVAILRAGKLVTVASIDDIRARARHEIEFEFAGAPPADAFARLNDVQDVAVNGERLTATVAGDIDALVKTAAHYTVKSIRTHDPDLEEIFLDLYRPDHAAPSASAPAVAADKEMAHAR